MNNSGSGLIAILVALVVLILAAALFLVPSRAGTAGPAVGGPRVGLSVTFARTPAGYTATVTIANTGTESAKNLRITKVSSGSLVGTTSLPIDVGVVLPGKSATLTLPFTGPVPAGQTTASLNLDYEYKFGWFGKGGGGSGVTSVLP